MYTVLFYKCVVLPHYLRNKINKNLNTLSNTFVFSRKRIILTNKYKIQQYNVL